MEPKVNKPNESTPYGAQVEPIVNNLTDQYDLSKLPTGWTVIPGRTNYTDLLRGEIAGPDGFVYIRYSGKTAPYDSYFTAIPVTKPYCRDLNTPEARAKKYIKSVMEGDREGKDTDYNTVYHIYTRDVYYLLEASGCYRGNGKFLRKYVKRVMNWYNTDDNREKMKPLTVGKFRNTKEGIRFQQFLEMFDHWTTTNQVCKIAESLDRGVFACMSGIGLPNGGIYTMWKGSC